MRARPLRLLGSFLLLPALVALGPRATWAQAIATVLVCPDETGCVEELYYARQDARFGDSRVLPLDEVLYEHLPDRSAQAENLVLVRKRIEAGEQYLRDRRMSGAAVTAFSAARAALDAFPYTVENRLVFRTYAGLASAQYLAGDPAFETTMRIAIASLVDQETPEEVIPPGLRQVFWDQARILQHERMAELAITTVEQDEGRAGDKGAVVFVNGVRVGVAPLRVPVMAGIHRVTVEHPNYIKPWRKNVDVRGAEKVDVVAWFERTEDPAYVLAELRGAFQTRDAPDDVKDVLSEWSTHSRFGAIRLLLPTYVDRDAKQGESVVRRDLPPPDQRGLGGGAKARDATGIPTTYDEDLTDILDSKEAAAKGVVLRFRTLWYLPEARRFDVRAPIEGSGRNTLGPGRGAVRFGAAYGRAGGLDHVGASIGVFLPFTHPVGLSVGIAVMRRTRGEYFYYREWVDPNLYEVALGVRGDFKLSGPARPFGEIVADVFVPYAVSALGSLGLDLFFTRSLAVTVQAGGGYGTAGPLLRVSGGLAQRF